MEFSAMFPKENGNFARKFSAMAPKIIGYAKRHKPTLFAHLPEVGDGKSLFNSWLKLLF